MYEGQRERYGMEWPGKRDCMKLIQEPSRATPKPCREESVDFDTTQNLFIEGDNLEVLKLLQKSYYGKVKMIYINPPYNTGKEFIYPDKYSEFLETYLAYAGIVVERLRDFESDVLRFMEIEGAPFTNNQGENDLRMTKVQQKISGCFRSMEGARILRRVRSYLSTCRKQGVSATEALSLLFQGKHPDFMRPDDA